MLVKGIVSATNIAAAVVVGTNNINLKVILKICAPFKHCTTEINNIQVINLMF